MQQIKKRNGAIVDFDAHKITEAMRKAFLSLNVPISEDTLREMTHTIISEVESGFPESTPSVENVQDRVEMILMKSGYLEVAKHYIVYRYQHTKIREAERLEVLEIVGQAPGELPLAPDHPVLGERRDHHDAGPHQTATLPLMAG